MDIGPSFRYPAVRSTGETKSSERPRMGHREGFQAPCNKGIRRSALRLYLFALALGIRIIMRGMFVEGVKLLISPVGYWRLLPNAFTYQEFRRLNNPRILDVSSPK